MRVYGSMSADGSKGGTLPLRVPYRLSVFHPVTKIGRECWVGEGVTHLSVHVYSILSVGGHFYWGIS